MKSHSDTRRELTAELRQAGWVVAKDAMSPLGKIDFSKLVAIHDHEEHFLKQTLLSTLIGVRTARISTPSEQGKITAGDVETALRMLGAAVAQQAEATLSTGSKRSIMDSCGFC